MALKENFCSISRRGIVLSGLEGCVHWETGGFCCAAVKDFRYCEGKCLGIAFLLEAELFERTRSHRLSGAIFVRKSECAEPE